MSEPSDKELRKAINAAVSEADGEPIGLKTLQKKLESQFNLGKGALSKRKGQIKEYLMLAMEEDASSSSESEEEVIMSRKGTVAKAKEDESRTRAGSEPVAVDEEVIDKTAGKSRAGQQPDHAGFLKKRGDQGRIKLWRKRHFRLYRKEGVIAYFKNENDTEQLGEVSVVGAFMIDKREDLGKNVFTVTMKITARVWILQANDEATMDQWIALCQPLMKETAAVRQTGDGKKPPRPMRGLPLPFPPTYVQGFTEREGTVSNLQNSADLDWTKLSQAEVKPVTLAPGQVALALHGKTACIEEVRELEVNDKGEAFITDLPKQLKYSMDSVGWASQDSQLMQVFFLHDEKTQRDLLKKLVGKTITASVPGNGAGHAEDAGKKRETRKQDKSSSLVGPASATQKLLGGGTNSTEKMVSNIQDRATATGGGQAFPDDASFTGKLFFDAKDERYALVDEGSNTVHFLNTRDARTIKVSDADVKQLNDGTPDTFQSATLKAHFVPGVSKTTGQLSYRLLENFETHINYVVTLNAEENKADVQGWYAIENKTSKTFNNAQVTVIPNPKAKAKEEEANENLTEEEQAAEEAKNKAKKVGGGLLAFAKSVVSGTPKVFPRHYHYPVTQNVTLPAYDWAHAAFLSQQVPATTEHLIRFELPEYTIKPQHDKDAGVKGKAIIQTVTRFQNPLTVSLPGGAAAVNRRNRNGLGNVKVASSVVNRVEGGEEIIIDLEEAQGITATRTQTGFNFDAEKHFIIETFEIVVVNTRHETVNVKVEESLFRWNNFEIPASKPVHSNSTTHPRKIFWNLRLNHGEDQMIKYTSFYSTFDLESDFGESDLTK